jgi:hypothetical protein
MRTLILVLATLLPAFETFAQSERDLAQYLQGKQVKVKIDMPSTKDGVDIYPNSNEPIKWTEYASRLKQNGRGLHAGDNTVITSVKVKEKHVEIQLGGGGYGTLDDSLKTIVVAPPLSKTEREKDLERDLKNAKDVESRKDLQKKLDRARNDRQREQRILTTLAQGQQAAKQAHAEDKAAETGSRFNIRFAREITSSDLSPEAIKLALGQYLDFEL